MIHKAKIALSEVALFAVTNHRTFKLLRVFDFLFKKLYIWLKLFDPTSQKNFRCLIWSKHRKWLTMSDPKMNVTVRK